MKYAAFLCCALLFVSFDEPALKKGKIIFQYDGNDKQIVNGIAKAYEVLKDERNLFFKNIKEKPDFDYTVESPKEIGYSIYTANLTLKIKGYAGGKENKTNAYVSSKYPNTIFINTDKTDRFEASIANTIIHEMVHSVDRKLTDASFGHGGNSSHGKKESAPYWIGKLSQNIISRETFMRGFTFTPGKIKDFYDTDEILHVEESEDIDLINVKN